MPWYGAPCPPSYRLSELLFLSSDCLHAADFQGTKGQDVSLHCCSTQVCVVRHALLRQLDSLLPASVFHSTVCTAHKRAAA
jgi:hypothetical protein